MLGMDFQREALEEALETLGAVLQEQRSPFELLAIGGSGLLLLGLIDRPTGDLDVIALMERGGFHKLEALPEPLQVAADQVGQALGLDERWLNTAPLFADGLRSSRRLGGETHDKAIRRVVSSPPFPRGSDLFQALCRSRQRPG